MSADAKALEQLQGYIADGEYDNAFQVLKRNPMCSLRKEDAQELLNNVEKLVAYDAIKQNNLDAYQRKVIEACSFLYARLERQKTLRGFGCVTGEDYPIPPSNDITSSRMEELSGLSVDALTPRQRTTYWRLAGMALVLAEFFFGSELGIDPLYTLIPGTFLLFSIDQLFYKGAAFESIYQRLFPEYKTKVISHEAGHFLISYLLGVPVRGCITSAWEARKYPDIKGQAGTIFFDQRLDEELSKQKITRTSINRMSVVIMGGIAAEALKFDKAEGGSVDEASLVGLLSNVQPPWNIMRIQGQARWAVLQALLLIREHQASYDALVKALEEGKGVGDIVMAIEDNLPAALPSAARNKEREAKRKMRETDLLLKYIQKMTYRVGGIEQAPAGTDTSRPNDEIVNSIVSDGAFASSSSAIAVVDAQSAAVQDGDVVVQFTEKIRMLEKAVAEGDVDVAQRASGGVWLNDLSSVKPVWTPSPTLPLTGTKAANLNIGEPLPGYEEALEKLRLSGEVAVEVEVSGIEEGRNLLKSKRGYQLKALENTQVSILDKSKAIDARLAEIENEIKDSNKDR